MFMAADMVRSSFAISEKAGLESGLDDQHLSINCLHAGSHQLGISGRRLPSIIPAENYQANLHHPSLIDIKIYRVFISKSCTLGQILSIYQNYNAILNIFKHYLTYTSQSSVHV